MIERFHQWTVVAEYPGAPVEPHRKAGPAPAKGRAAIVSMSICGTSSTRMSIAVDADSEDEALTIGHQVAQHWAYVFHLPAEPTDLIVTDGRQNSSVNT